MSPPGTSRVPVLTVMLFLLAALLLRSWLQTSLVIRGTSPTVAADLSYLVVPPLVFVFLFPLLRNRLEWIVELFRCRGITLSVLLHAITIGLLLRIADWCQLIAGVALGLYADPTARPQPQPSFVFHCPDSTYLLLALLVTVILIPFVEEFIHRGLIQSSLEYRGPLIAIPVASALFAICHRSSSWPMTFLGGLVLGVLFWKTRSLWPSLITHATVNALALLDWRCLQGQWNPTPSSLPLWQPAIPSLVAFALAVVGVVFLLCKKIPGSMQLPGNEQVTERLRPVR